MKDSAQLLIVSGLLMSITIIAVSSTITHSVNTSSHQGERHDLTPLLSMVETHLPLALEYEVDNAPGGRKLETSFEVGASEFESIFASNGYSLAFILSSSDDAKKTFDYKIIISDGVISVTLGQNISV